MNHLARPEMFKIAGIAGVIFGLIGVITPSLFYKGTKGQKYSFLNHFISELGEQGVSRFAWVFNLGMILAGVCIVIASLSFGAALARVLGESRHGIGRGDWYRLEPGRSIPNE